MIQDYITACRDTEHMDKLHDSRKDMLQDTGYRIHAGLSRVPTFLNLFVPFVSVIERSFSRN